VPGVGIAGGRFAVSVAERCPADPVAFPRGRNRLAPRSRRRPDRPQGRGLRAPFLRRGHASTLARPRRRAARLGGV